MNNTAQKRKHEPLFHVVNRGKDAIPLWKGIAIRAIAIIFALIVGGIILVVLTKENPVEIYKTIYDGAFGTERRYWKLLQELSVLLCISLAVTPAFKMQFWNIGAEGQALMGGLATAAVMFYLGGKVPNGLLWVIMAVSAILMGAIWGLIPAIFKALWNTNETLFTLMMNYIATQFVSVFIYIWVKDGSAVLSPMHEYGLPVVGDQKYMLNVIIVAVLTIAMQIYLKYSKQGYEISVVGQSEKTARYIGINVKKVIIRTMLISGAICGVAGLILVGGTDHTVRFDTVGGNGFTAIMVSWLAKFSPIMMVLTSFLIVFLDQGASHVTKMFGISSDICDIMIAIILFFIIGCEFFINYKIKFRSFGKGGKD
ncbi:MAG: ABC transporter permease [Clostridia bacterium]|nr:ABC transporter permease [Clostridia bacterium]